MPEERIYWMSPVPGFCETCDGPIHEVFYDAKMVQGPWALMCPSCFTLGPGIGKLGLGLGQKYVKAKDGKFYKEI